MAKRWAHPALPLVPLSHQPLCSHSADCRQPHTASCPARRQALLLLKPLSCPAADCGWPHSCLPGSASTPSSLPDRCAPALRTADRHPAAGGDPYHRNCLHVSNDRAPHRARDAALHPGQGRVHFGEQFWCVVLPNGALVSRVESWANGGKMRGTLGVVCTEFSTAPSFPQER